MVEKVDVLEDKILQIDRELFSILLTDQSTKQNIKWCTDNYQARGFGYQFNDSISIESVTGANGDLIKPRVKKTKEEQKNRIKKKAEVFTPAWVCNHQNNLVDEIWFNAKDVFNTELDRIWKVNQNPIDFNQYQRNWQDYITNTVLEITCGEAPYLVSRYDVFNGTIIAPNDRIGALDRKLRVINENVNHHDDWWFWVQVAYTSVYGYEWQGDSLLIARENLLYTFLDNYQFKFKKMPSVEMQRQIAEIISWNIWQMDGIKMVIPNSCQSEAKSSQNVLFGESKPDVCLGCKKNDVNKHQGIYSKIREWFLIENKKPRVHTFVSSLKEK